MGNINGGNIRREGVAISIGEDLTPFIKKRTIGGRSMELRLKAAKSTKRMSILNTYAPHIGYDATVIKNYWDGANAYISIIPRKYIKYGALITMDKSGEMGKMNIMLENRHYGQKGNINGGKPKQKL